ncbi:MAG: TfoX/Sxy family protein [Candidatus Pacebacteria bacterium]|nr:TfoX/Sxy family protein [Candidatus Paceibacterota bacterium]
MSTQKETVDFILEKLGADIGSNASDTDTANQFSTRAMFGEYALYAAGKVVALICDEQLYVKIVPASAALENICEKSEAYKGSKPYYLVEESQLSQIAGLSKILFNIAKSLPEKRKK